jgi:hypothetical protein
VLVFASMVASACGSTPERSATAAAPAPTPKAVGTLAQVMRGIYFPNANLLFDVQQKDPGAPPGSGPEGARGSVSEQFASIYTGWQVVENAAISIAESIDLLMVPGRHCQNGKPVPIDRPEYIKAAQGMRQAAMVALEAARAKDREKAIEATNTIADGCAACHEVYRDKGDADSPARCTP